MKSTTKAHIIVALNAITLLISAVIILLLFKIITNTARVATETNGNIIASQKLTEKELRCLANFFSQTDRNNLRIDNLENCRILNTETGKTAILTVAPAPTTQSLAPVTVSQDKNNQINTKTKTRNDLTQSEQVPEQPSTTAKKVLGVEVCIPLTKKCVR